MDVSFAIFGIVALFATLIKAAVIVVLILMVIKFIKNKPDTKKYQYGKRTYPQKNNKSFSWDKPKRNRRGVCRMEGK